MKALRTILAPLASLRLTVTLLAASMFLVLAGTVAQIDFDIWQVQHAYFHSWWTWVPLQSFLPRPHAGDSPIPGSIPFLGGYALIALLLINLLSAHAVRFKLQLRRTGVLLIHFGLILLLLGEIVTSQVAHEGQMVLAGGQTFNYTQDTHLIELAVVDRSPADHDSVVVIAGSRLRPGELIHDARLPFDVRIDDFFPNSQILGPMQAGADANPLATAGAGQQLTVKPIPPFSGASDDSDKTNQPSAYVTLLSGGRSLGTYLVSEFFDGPQSVVVDGATYWVQLRPKRYYKPYSVTLVHFTHSTYLGSDTPKDFASLVRIVDPSHGVDRQVKIWMNHPLRFDGDVFYQQSFLQGDTGTVLQVVDNPGRTLPYIACAVGALGMLIHFGTTLIKFLNRRTSSQVAAIPRVSTRGQGASEYTLRPLTFFSSDKRLKLGLLAAAAALIYLIAVMKPPAADPAAFDYAAFGRIPVTYDGRTMPLDSLARNSLRILSNIDEVHDQSETLSADQWLAEVMANTPRARKLQIFRIDYPDITTLLDANPQQTRFSFDQIAAHASELDKQMQQLNAVPASARDPYQQKLAELWEHLTLYMRLEQWNGNPREKWDGLFIIPPLAPGEQWATWSGTQTDQTSQTKPAATWINAIILHYRDQQISAFNDAVHQYLDLLEADMPGTMKAITFETFFNRTEPFYQSMMLYIAAFVLAALSWMLWRPLGSAAVGLLLVGLLVHTLGLASRAYLTGRPPVTNLYSSAVFIGWGAVVLAVALERVFSNGIATALAAMVGFVTLFIAHHLALNPVLTPTGDTMEMMRAVLDTNLWLGTHVLCITLGYATTFFAGTIAAVYVLGGMFSTELGTEQRKSLSQMLYGTICFAMFFSFVGTILGGIWADQSWGRFWGWDPKENGAVLIVLWNALILHARWSGIARQRGVALLAIFGNIVTSWSWFGTNMLGIGLHSYGFMAAAATWLAIFMLSQLSLILIGLTPQRYWRSFLHERAAGSDG